MDHRRRARGERGVSLVEVMVTASLFVLVTAAVLGTFESFTRAQHAQDQSIEARSSLRQALDEVAHDLRNATEIHPDPVRTGDVIVLIGWTGSLRTKERLRAEVEQGYVSRDASKTRSRTVLAGLVDPGGPVFTYLRADGSTMDPAEVGADTIGACTATVRVELAVRPHGQVVRSSTDVQLRNRIAEASAC